jgi:signal peptidase
VATFAALMLAVFVRPDAQGADAILGHPLFSVASGSMTPVIDTGDLIVDSQLTSAQASDLHAGQIISFQTASAGTTSIVITHRIVAVFRASSGGGVQYQTKGDANNAPDQALVTPGQIVGLYTGRVPLGGYALSTLHQPLTFVILVMIAVVYLIGGEVRRRWVLLGEQDRLAKEEKLAGTAVDGTPEAEVFTAGPAERPSRVERDWGAGY